MKNPLSTAAALGVMLSAAAAWAQNPIGAPVTPGGVEVDGEGVLHGGKASADPRLKDLWKGASHFKKDGRLLYISLSRLFEEARKCAEEGKALPDDIKYLGGLVRLQYMFLYPEERDLVIAGPAEPFDSDVPYRPLGKISGRPVLQFDDLVVALRSCGPGKTGTHMGCDLRITNEIAKRIADKTKELAPQVNKIGEKKAAQMIADAGGNQPITYFGVARNTRTAMVCIEADYHLKQFALGVLDTPVKKVKAYSDHATKPEPAHRFLLVSNEEHLLVSEDRTAWEFTGASLRVDGAREFVEADKMGEISDAARKFIEQASEQVEELSKHLVSWADLANLADLAVLASLIGQDDTQEKLGWDLSWVLRESGWKVAEISTPSSAKTVTTTRHYGGYTIFCSGGALIKGGDALKKPGTDAKGVLKSAALRPDSGSWNAAKKPAE